MEGDKVTSRSYLWTHLLNAPLFTIYTLLTYILYREMHASLFQITLFISIKPASALFSAYWSSKRVNKSLKENIVWIGILGKIPSLFFPFITNPWFFIASFGLYIIADRAVTPSWMETLRQNLSSEERTRIVSKKSLYIYLTNLFFPLLLMPWIDTHIEIWKWVFSLCTLISLLGFFTQRHLKSGLPPIRVCGREGLGCNILDRDKANSHRTIGEERSEIGRQGSSDPQTRIGGNPGLRVAPPKKLTETPLALLKRRPDFAFFQLVFMMGGMGLMIIHPMLPAISTNISYGSIAVATLVCKGVGFALASPFWRPWLHRVNIYALCAVVTVFAAIFPLLLILSGTFVPAFYIAFLIYGVMQAGSELAWQLSGPIFAQKEDSSLYTTVNILMIGLRGCIGPMLGGYLLSLFGMPTWPLFIGCVTCLAGTLFGLIGSRKYGAQLQYE